MSVGRAGGAPEPRHLGRFGKYTLVARLATGGMAEVFLARYTGLAGFERQVVIKRILPHHARDERYVTMFLAEARIAARLTHSNIAHVYELGEVDGHYYMAMEYLEGVTFDTLARRLKLEQKSSDLRLIGGLIVQACEGLHHAHDLKGADGEPLEVVHRDVSPHNLFVTTSGVLKVLDFGVAKAQWATPRTEAGVVKGTYAYMSPEQLRGEKLDRRSDVFGLGIVLFELVTLKRLFHRDTDYLIFNAITTEDIPKVADVRPEVPSDLAATIVQALARNRNDRIKTARDLGLAVTRSLESIGGPLLPGAISKEVYRLCGDDLDELRSVIAAGGRPEEPPPSDEEDHGPTEAPTVRPGMSHPPIGAAEEKPTVPGSKSRSPDLDTTEPPKKPLPSPLTAVGPPPLGRSVQHSIKFVDEPYEGTTRKTEQDQDADEESTTTAREPPEEETGPTAAGPVEPAHPRGFITPVPEDPFDGPTSIDPEREPADSTGKTLPGDNPTPVAYTPAQLQPSPLGLTQEKTVPANPLLGRPQTAAPRNRSRPPPSQPPLAQQPRVPTAQIPMNARLAHLPPPPRGTAGGVPNLRFPTVRTAKLLLAFFLSAGVGIALLLLTRWLLQDDRAPEPKPAPAPVTVPVRPPAPAPAPAAVPAPAGVPAPPAAAAPAASPSPSPSPKPEQSLERTDPRFPKPTKKSGFLTVEGKTGQAVIDGKPIGALPLRRYPLNPGRHDVIIKMPKGKPKHFLVHIRTGKEVPVRVE